MPARHPLLVFFLAVFLGAMILGPLVFLVCAGHVPFHRAMDRGLLIAALAAVAMLRARFDFRALWPLDRRAALQVIFGLLLAAISVQTILALAYAFHGFTRAHVAAPELGHIALIAAVAALLVPFAEETVFRGFVLHELARSFRRRTACLLAALVFMLAHFVKIPVELDGKPVGWSSGVTAVAEALLPVARGEFLSMRGLNLLLIGLVLGGLYLRSGRLWVNYGLHAGWIAALLTVPKLTRPVADAPFDGADLLSHPATTLVMVALGLWLARYYHTQAPGSDGSGPGPGSP